MTAEYDAIAEEYRRTKNSPLRRHIEAYTLFELIGDLTGLSVLDLACGDGFYARQFKQRGAERVIGVDVSGNMIALAREDEANQPLGIEYVCSDVQTMPDLGAFDIVVAAYLLHYAPDETALTAMCRRIASHLRPGGRFIGLNENPDQQTEQYRLYTQYGFNKAVEGPLEDGRPIRYSVISGRDVIRFTAYYFAADTYARAFAAAGLAPIKWYPLRLSPEGRREGNANYWQDYLSNPPIVGMESSL